MYNFEELRKEGREAMKAWHNKNNRQTDSSIYLPLVPSRENNFSLSFKDIEEAFPEITMGMSKSPQDPKYHSEGDVWTHTKMVMEEMFAQEFYQNSDFETQQILFWSAFLHDVSKPITVDFNEDKQQITNENHSVKGASDIRLFMWKNNFPLEMREIVARIVRYHQKPFHWHKEMSEFDLRKWSQDLPLNLLISMARADARGRRYLENSEINIKKTLENLELMEFMAIENDCLDKPWLHNFDSVIARKIYFDANGRSYVDRPVVYDGGSDVIFLSGLPASGKDYWVDKFGENKPVLSYDDAREKLGLKQKYDGKAVQEVKENMKILLRKKEPFIINATHINEDLRGKNLALLKSYNATIRIIHLEADYNTLKKRNEERNDNIPEKVIMSMARKWSPPTSLECHELMWWDRKAGKPIYRDYLTSKKDENNPWEFSKK